jgi:ubiquinone/menaquinone biosynthesis methyltransferase
MAQRFTLKIGDRLRSPDTKRDYNEKVFAEIAPRYDFITRALSFGRDAAWKQDLIAALPPRAAPVCVDLACGTGDIAFLLADKYPQGEVLGIDITDDMLDIARRRNRHSNANFLKGDMGRLRVPPQSADIVTGGYALRNAPDLDRVIDEVRRVLKPRGVAAFLDFSRSPARLPQRLQYRILKAWGGFWGLALHGNAEVYGYIAESLACFPDRESLRRLFRQKGFIVVHSQLYFFGVTELLVVRKTD